jgi:hypothetical protein
MLYMSRKDILDPKPKNEAIGNGQSALGETPQGEQATEKSEAAVTAAVDVQAGLPQAAIQLPAPAAQQPPPDGPETPEPPAPIPPANEPLKKLPEGWRQFSVEGLAALCKQARLPANGTRAALAKRLDTKFFGVSTRQVNGRMKCRYCDAQARPNGVRKLNEEGTIVERYYKCNGRRSHTFHFQEFIEPDADADKPGPAAAGGEPSAANLQRFRKRVDYL